MNNDFSLGGMGPTERGTVKTLSLVHDLDFRVGLCCWQKNQQREDLFQSSRISSSPPFAVRLHPLWAPPDDICKASSDAKHRFTYRSHRTRKIPPRFGSCYTNTLHLSRFWRRTCIQTERSTHRGTGRKSGLICFHVITISQLSN